MAKTYTEHLFKGSVVIFLLSGVAAAIGYLIRLYLARNLSVMEFGLFFAILSFVGFFSVFKDLGLGQTMVKFIAEMSGSEERGKMKSVFITSLFIQFIIAVILMGAIAVFSDALAADYFKMPEASLPLKIIAFSGIAGTIMTIIQQVSQGLGKVAIYATAEPLRLSLSFIFIYLLIPMGIAGVSYSYVIAAVIVAAYLLISLRNTDVLRGKSGISLGLTKKMLIFSLPIFVGGLSSLLLFYTDTITLTIFRGVEEVGLYQAALPTSQLLWMFVTPLLVIMLPTISQMWGKKQTAEISNSLAIISKFSFAVVIPFSMIMAAFAEDIIRVLFGAAYAPATAALQVLAINSIFYTLFAIFSISLIAINRPFTNTKITVLISAVNLVLNLALVPQYGLTAAAFSTLVSYFIGAIIAFYSIHKILPVNIGLVSMAKIFSGGVLSLLVIFIIKTALVSDLWIEAAVSLVASASFYILFILRVRGIKQEELKVLMTLNVPIPRFLINLVNRLSS